MNQRDMRPPFAALGGTIPPELEKLPTPCYLLDEDALTRNAEILGGLAQRTGCKVLLAQKAFSNYDCYPLLAPHLAGTEASGLFEARLGADEMPGKEVHVFCAASWRSSALPQKRQAKAWGCASTRNAPPRTATLFMTPAPPAAALAPPAPSGTPQ